MSRRKINWSDLPSQLLYQIATRLETRPDILHFRAVSKDWHRSVSLTLLSYKTVLSLILPHKLSTPNPPLFKGGAHSRLQEFYEDVISVNSLILVTSSVFLIKPVFNLSLPPWVVTVEEVNPGEVCLRRPFTRSAVVDKPGYFPKVLDLSRFEVEEMEKMYSLRFDKQPNHLFEEAHKVLLIVEAGCETVSTIDDCIAVVLYDNGALSAIRLKDESVKQLFVKARKFDDIVMFKGTVYVLDRYGKLYYIDNGTSDRLKMVNVVEKELKLVEARSRLVESCGELYLVRKCKVSRPHLQRQRMGLRVYKLNQELMTWDEVDSIGKDSILFVTLDCCFFARVSDFVGWTGNCVVFHGRGSFYNCSPTSYEFDPDEYERVLKRDGCKLDIEVFHFQECKFESVESNPVYSLVFWPPPKWISSDASLLERSESERTADLNQETEIVKATVQETEAELDAPESGVKLDGSNWFQFFKWMGNTSLGKNFY